MLSFTSWKKSYLSQCKTMHIKWRGTNCNSAFYSLHAPSWTFLILPLLKQSATSNSQLLEYVFPSDPHIGMYTRGQGRTQIFSNENGINKISISFYLCMPSDIFYFLQSDWLVAGAGSFLRYLDRGPKELFAEGHSLEKFCLYFSIVVSQSAVIYIHF
jgi:hypothetical protein